MRFAICTLVAAGLLFSALPALGQTSAELLQKGIYTQETVGDIDSAIKIYRQVVASASESRALGAQAQFRLGVCLLKKGDRTAAVKAFEQLVQDYPDQKELVAQAREYLPSDSGLLPIPWSDGELAEYRIKLPGGMALGTFLYTAEANPARPQNLLLTTRAWLNGNPHQWSRVEVERDTMRPISNTYSSPLLGEFRIDYEDRQARMQPKSKPAKTIPLDGLHWDNEEALWVMRRMPLSVGYKGKLPIVGPAGIAIKLDVEVPAIEEVQVAAGKFRAYKLVLELVRQTIWISVDAPRLAVKLEAPGATIELVSVRRVDHAPVHYRDTKTGLSLTAPAGWLLQPNEETPAGETLVTMLDPDGRSSAGLWAKSLQTDAAQVAQQLRDSLNEKIKARTSEFKGYQVRSASIQTRAIGGRQAMSAVADYLEGEKKMAEYLIFVTAPKTKTVLFSRFAADEFEALQKRFDAIAETTKIE